MLEQGLLHPGDRLYFGANSAQTALVLADGSIEYNGKRGSIHQMARCAAQDLTAPVNGWQAWFYSPPGSAGRLPLDHLRQQLRTLYLSQFSEELA